MKYKLNSTLLIIIILSISGCSAVKMAQQKYPERIKYSLDDSTTGLTNIYLCKNIDGIEKTNERVKVAHNYLSRRIEEISRDSVSKMFEAKKFSFWSAVKSSATLQSSAKNVAKEIEEKYKCTLVDAID